MKSTIKKRVSLCIDEETGGRIENYAMKKSISKSAAVRFIVNTFLDEGEANNAK